MHPFGVTELALLVSLWLVTGLGVTVGYHRLFTHRTFRAAPPAELALAVFGSMAGQGGVVSWAALHRRHHECSDSEGDPHSPNLSGGGLKGRLRGLAHSHFLWRAQAGRRTSRCRRCKRGPLTVTRPVPPRPAPRAGPGTRSPRSRR